MKQILLLAALSAGVSAVQAQSAFPSLVEFNKSNCLVRVRAYVDPDEKNPKYQSRFDLFVAPAKEHPAQWEFTLPSEENYPGNNISAAFAPVPYGHAKRTTIRATLHRFDTYDETLTFKNLPLAPWPTIVQGIRMNDVRHLELKEAQTQTTPGGISVTLPAQSVDAIPFNWNGPMSGVFIRVQTSPSTKLSRLPQSPLWKKYNKPIQIKLDVAQPYSMGTYMADNTYPLILVGITYLRSATTLDLTLIVRQKVELETVPVALEVPIFRSQQNPKG